MSHAGPFTLSVPLLGILARAGSPLAIGKQSS